jgi:hypothetical protein
MTVLAEEFVDAFDDPVTLAYFPPTFETLTRSKLSCTGRPRAANNASTANTA